MRTDMQGGTRERAYIHGAGGSLRVEVGLSNRLEFSGPSVPHQRNAPSPTV